MICVLVVASGAAWEPSVLAMLADQPDLVVLRRCVDVEDLLAAASAGQADVAVVAMEAPGLNASAVAQLRRHQVRVVGVVDEATSAAWDAAQRRAGLIGAVTVARPGDLEDLAAVLARGDEPMSTFALTDEVVEDETPTPGGRVLTVWGPHGAPGRTTVAIALACELAARGQRTLLVDADPYGGSVTAHLGVLEEVSGLLAASRLAATGALADRFASVQRSLGPRLTVISGLPRADRWPEVRAGVLDQIAGLGRARGHVVVDTGPFLEADPGAELGGRPARNGLTLEALRSADEILVVATPDPIGVARVARGLVDLRELAGNTPTHLVVNRQRASLGWSTGQVEELVGGFGRLASTSLLPEDQETTDRALAAGRALRELGSSPLGHAVEALADVVVPSSRQEPRRRGRRRLLDGRRG